MQYQKIMCLDYGDARIGIAFTDFLQITVNPYEIYHTVNKEKDIEYISNLAHNNSVNLIVIGMPYSLDGQSNDRTRITQDFGTELEQFSKIKVVYEDERLSSYILSTRKKDSLKNADYKIKESYKKYFTGNNESPNKQKEDSILDFNKKYSNRIIYIFKEQWIQKKKNMNKTWRCLN